MMKPFICFLTFLFAVEASAQNLEKRLDSLLRGHVRNGEIHGCIAYVYQKGEVMVFKPYGYMDIENNTLMEKDAIFRIASMTKMLTAAAALKLYEAGKFELDDPVKKYIPEFAGLKVIDPECRSIETLITIPLERDVTIRDLFRHTAGFSYGGSDLIGELYAKNLNKGYAMTIEQFVREITALPLKFQPGSRWEYSFSIDILGYLVEVLSGEKLDVYLEKALFKPLGMNHTGFYVPAESLGLLCNHYEYSGDRLFVVDKAPNSQFAEKPVFISGGGGAVSTARDYSRFCRMLLNYGEYDGKRILEKETVEMMISDQIGDISDRSFELPGYGLGVGVYPGTNGRTTDGIYWAGAPYNNYYMIDYTKDLIAILFIQNSPWDHLNIREKFRQIIDEETKN